MQGVDHYDYLCYNKNMIESDFIRGVSNRYSTLDQLPDKLERIKDANALRAMGCSVVGMIALSSEYPDSPELNRDKEKAKNALTVYGKFRGPLAEPIDDQEDAYFVPSIGYAVWEVPEVSES